MMTDEQREKDICAIILAGGLGSRLREIVSDRQKAVADVNGKPFVDFLLRQLKYAGIEEIIIACGYRSNTVRNILSPQWKKLKYSVEQKPLGTGGALKLALRQTDADWIIVMNGDSFLDFDPRTFVKWSVDSGHQATIALVKVDNVSRYGKIDFDNGKITAFSEKGVSRGAGLINAGVYCFRRKTLAKFMQHEQFSLEKDIFPDMVNAGLLYGQVYNTSFIDIGTPDSYNAAQSFFKDEADIAEH